MNPFLFGYRPGIRIRGVSSVWPRFERKGLLFLSASGRSFIGRSNARFGKERFDGGLVEVNARISTRSRNTRQPAMTATGSKGWGADEGGGTREKGDARTRERKTVTIYTYIHIYIYIFARYFASRAFFYLFYSNLSLSELREWERMRDRSFC